MILTSGFPEGALQVPPPGETSADCLPQAPARPLASQLEQNIWQSPHSPQVYAATTASSVALYNQPRDLHLILSFWYLDHR